MHATLGRKALGLILTVAASSAVAVHADNSPINTLTPAEQAAGWTLLFDGEQPDQWRGFKQEGFPEKGWAVEDGALHVVAGGGGGDIISRDTYTNFELMLEFKPGPRANSGIMYRVTEEHDAPWKTGPEFQILDDAGHNLAPENMHSSGSLYDITAPPKDKTFKPGDWNTVRIRLNNGVVEHWLNGTQVVKENLDSQEFAEKIAASKFASFDGFGVRQTGHLALQDHGHDVWFRNIKVRDLDAPLPKEIALFDVWDYDRLTMIRTFTGVGPTLFGIRGGLLVCYGGPIGYLRTNVDYTNYVLKLDWRFSPRTRREGNGGVLLRMIGEDKVWPRSIEAQLQSKHAGDFWNIDKFEMSVAEDRTSGRNTKKTHFAENPVGEWNEYEIIVDRDVVILRVNGQEVNRAWDVAEVAGKIGIQAEGTEMHFRNIRLSEIKYGEE